MTEIVARILGGPKHGQMMKVPRGARTYNIMVPNFNVDPWEADYTGPLYEYASCPVVSRYPNLHPFLLDDLIDAGDVVAYIDYDNATFHSIGVNS